MANFDQRRRPTARPRYASIDGIVRVKAVHPRVQQPQAAVRPAAHHPTIQAAKPRVAIAPSLPRMDGPQPKRRVTFFPRLSGKSAKKKLIIRGVIGVVAIFIVAGGWLAWRGLSTANRVLHGNIFSDAHAFLSTTKLKGEDQGRVNILLAGDSADDTGHQGANLTDSIMVLSVNTKTHTGFMLSVPRDLWVSIPGWSHEKINAANVMNGFKEPGYPSGGMGQLEKILQTDLGVPIDYYALVNYTAFKDSVDAVGGINVTIQSDDARGLYDPNISKADGGPLLLKNGLQTLDGQTALNLARARGDPTSDGRVAYGFPSGDYTRTQHQRQMLTALEQKASGVGVLANPLKISKLFNAVGNNVSTDLSLGDVLRATQIMKGISISKLQSLTLSESGPNALLTNYVTPDGQDALIPRAGLDEFSQIQQYYKQLTSTNPVVQEGPTAVVLNGGNTTGLAHNGQTNLTSKGFSILSVADANGTYPTTTIVDTTNGQKPASRQALQQMYPKSTIVTSTNVSPEANEAAGYSADFVVILGQDQATTTHPTASATSGGGD